jgi:hypothetical protein
MTRAMTASLCWAIVCATSALAQEPIVQPYFPLKVGHRWTYRVSDPKSPAAKAGSTVIEVERQEVYTEKIKDKEKGTETTKDYTGFVLKTSSGPKSTLDYVVVLPSGVYRIYVAKTPINPPMMFFKFGKSGDTWPLDAISGNKDLKGTFTIKAAKADSVIVPYSKAPLKDVWIVSFHNNKQGEEREEVDTWFAPEIGMVKLRRKGQGQEVLLELEKFDKAK